MRTAFLVLIAAAILGAPGCGDARNVDFGGRDVGAELFAIHTRDGSVKMALTDGFLVISLSDSMAERTRSDVRERTDDEGSGRLSAFLDRAVDRALSFRAAYPNDEAAARELIEEFHALRSGPAPAP